MNAETNAKLEKLASDQKFASELLSQETPEKAQEFLAANGVEMTLDEVKSFGKMLNAVEESGDELSEDALEEVAGGSLALGWAIAKLVIAAGGAALALYKWYKSTR